MPPEDTDTPDTQQEPPVTYPYRHVGVTPHGLIIHTIVAPGLYFTMELSKDEVERLVDTMHDVQHEDAEGPQLKLVKKHSRESED